MGSLDEMPRKGYCYSSVMLLHMYKTDPTDPDDDDHPEAPARIARIFEVLQGKASPQRAGHIAEHITRNQDARENGTNQDSRSCTRGSDACSL